MEASYDFACVGIACSCQFRGRIATVVCQPGTLLYIRHICVRVILSMGSILGLCHRFDVYSDGRVRPTFMPERNLEGSNHWNRSALNAQYTWYACQHRRESNISNNFADTMLGKDIAISLAWQDLHAHMLT